MQDTRDGAAGAEVRGGEHEVAARSEDAVDLGHHVHRVGEQVLDELAAELKKTEI